MDTCAAEVGLLKKHPCGHAAVAKCSNCEMALCNKHAVAQLSPTKQRTGKYMCEECDKAQRAYNKNVGETASAPPAASPQPAKAAPAAPAAKAPAAPAAKAPAAPAAKPAAPAAAAAAKPAPATKEFKLEDTGPIEFTPKKK